MAKKIIQEFLRFGLDFSVKPNVRKVARILGVSPDMVDRIYIELRNEIDRETFSETELSEREYSFCLNASVIQGGAERFLRKEDSSVFQRMTAPSTVQPIRQKVRQTS